MSKIEKTRNQLFQQAAMTQQVSLEKPRGLYEVKRSPERDLLLQTLKEKRLQRKIQRYRQTDKQRDRQKKAGKGKGLD